MATTSRMERTKEEVGGLKDSMAGISVKEQDQLSRGTGWKHDMGNTTKLQIQLTQEGAAAAAAG